jgi:hypothetical protein
MEKKEGKRVKELKSNVTDNDSAMIQSSKGSIQGYIVSRAENRIPKSRE